MSWSTMLVDAPVSSIIRTGKLLIFTSTAGDLFFSLVSVNRYSAWLSLYGEAGQIWRIFWACLGRGLRGDGLDQQTWEKWIFATRLALFSECWAGTFRVGPGVSTVMAFSWRTAIRSRRSGRLLLHGTVSRDKICGAPWLWGLERCKTLFHISDLYFAYF